MLSFVIVACLAANPTQCTMQEMERVEMQGLRSCKLLMQPRVASWQIAHPDQIVKNAFCKTFRPVS